MGSMPEPVRKASERAAATIAAIRNTAAPAVAEPPAERKPAPRPRRADTRIYPGPAPEPAAPVVSSRADSGTIVAGPHPPRRTPRTRVTPIPAVAQAEPAQSTRHVSIAVEEPAASVEAAEPMPATNSTPPAASAEIQSPVEPATPAPYISSTTQPAARPIAAADLSDPESSDKLRIATEILSTGASQELRIARAPQERVATPEEISSLKSRASPAPPIDSEPAASEKPVNERKLAPLRVMPVSAPSEPQWRRELSSRVEAYRAKRRSSDAADGPASQDSLPFNDAALASDATLADADTAPDPRASLRLHARNRPPQNDKIEISAAQPELNFVAAEQMRPFSERLVPVAELAERRAAGLLDSGFLLFSYGLFLGLFGSLGGNFRFGRLDLLVYGVTFFLFYVQYFVLFTAFGGVTPGMGMRGLRVVAFDGNPAGARQLVWRSFGYIISAATMMLGFLWAMWDDDTLTWHDRMSQTYLTAAAHVARADQISAT